MRTIEETAEAARAALARAKQGDIARQALGVLEAERLGGWRAYGLPRLDEVVLTPDELADHARMLGLTPAEMAGYALQVLWLPRYARLLGMTVDKAAGFIKDYLSGYGIGGRSGTAPPHPIEATGGGDEPAPEIETAEAARARAAARPLVARVLGLLSPEQSDYFSGGYPSVERAESYLEDELVGRLAARGVGGGDDLSKQVSDEVVRAAVAGIVGDYEKSKHDGDHDDLDYQPDEPIALETEPLEARHGDDLTPEEFDHRGHPLPVGTALEAEISGSVADDRVGEGSIDGLLLPLGDLPLPGGKGTYRDRLKHLGDERMVVTAALRACGGDPGKALQWLIDEVNKSIQAEESRAATTKPPESSRVGAGTGAMAKVSGRTKRSVKIRAEDIREPVLEGHRVGAGADEIIEELRKDKGLPDWVRTAKKPVLEGLIGKIIDRYESERAEASARDE